MYLHVRKVKVKVGDKIEAGALLGCEGDKGAGGAYTHVEVQRGRMKSPHPYRDAQLESDDPYAVMLVALNVPESGREPLTARKAAEEAAARKAAEEEAARKAAEEEAARKAAEEEAARKAAEEEEARKAAEEERAQAAEEEAAPQSGRGAAPQAAEERQAHARSPTP